MVLGERSARYFESVKSVGSEVVITGSPRFEGFLKRAEVVNVKTENSILGVFTNPIDDCSFCTKDEKLALFECFIERGRHNNQSGLILGIKTHFHEKM